MEEDAVLRVGFLGLGLMGTPIALNILRAGHELCVWNRDPSAADALRDAGARVAASPAELGEACDVICTCLPNGQVVKSVLAGDRGALTSAAAGTLVIDHSTIAPQDARALWTTCNDRGMGFLDAPVSGGPEGAASGKLSIFVGGEPDHVERARPLLEAYGAAVVHLGGPGAGQISKLANQIIIGTTVLGLSEAFAYTQAEGVDPARLLEVLKAATADSAMLRSRTPVPGLQDGMPASNDWLPGFSADFMAKDLGFALEGAGAANTPCAGTALVHELLLQVIAAGRGDSDWTLISQYLDGDPT